MLAKRAVREDWKDDDGAGSIVGDEEELAGFVQREIARIFAKSGKLIELGEPGRFSIETEGSNGALLAGLVCRVNEFSAGMNDKPGGIACFRSETFRGQLASLRVELVSVDAFAVGFVGV